MTSAMLVAQAVPVAGIAVQAIRQLLPHEGGVAAGRRLARIEQGRARAPHHRRRDGAGLVMAHDVAELVDMVEPHDHHERLRQFGVIGAGAVARRLAEIEMKGEQRRQQIVLKALRPVRESRAAPAASSSRSRKVWCGLSEDATKMPGADHFTFGGFDPDRAAALDENALGLGHQPDVAARCAHRRFERARERRRAAARHLRLGRARQQRGDVMAEAAAAAGRPRAVH